MEDITYDIMQGLSDHTCQLVHLDTPQILLNNNITLEKRNITDKNIRKFITNLQIETWTENYNSNKSIETHFISFMDTLCSIFDETFPKVKVKTQINKQNRKGWITHEIKHFSKLKRKFIREKQVTGKQDSSYTEFIRFYKHLIVNAKKEYYVTQILKSKNKNKKLWEIVNEGITLKPKPKTTNIKLTKDKDVIVNPIEISEAFNDYFVDVVKKLSNKKPSEMQENVIKLLKTHSPRNPHSMFLTPTNEYEVHHELNNLKESKSVGDDIPVRVIKQCSNTLTPILTYLYNQCLESGTFPSKLKIAKIHPIHKRGDRTNIENYRPISLLPIFSKILEKLIQKRLQQFLLKHKIITDQQHGFIPKKSTTTAAYSLINTILEGLNNKQYILGIFCDLTKAFDLVNHEMLLIKLEHYGIRGIALQLIRSYLQDRKQSVEITQMVNGNSSRHNSKYRNVSQGVPQGSILGPLLFLLYINDLPNNIPDAELILYADDTSAIIKDKCMTTFQEKTNKTMQQLKTWFKYNGLILNETKTHFVLFHTRQNKNNPMTIDINHFKLDHETIFLGLHLNENLNWDGHIQNLIKTLNTRIYALRILKNTLDAKALIQVYYAICHSIIRYSIIFWGSSPSSVEIFKKQKLALRTILGLGNRDSCSEHFKHHKILTVPSLYIYETVLFIKKYSVQTHLKNNSYDIRNKNNLETYIPRLTKVQQGPLHMGIKIYNKLPPFIKDRTSVRSFTNALKTFLQGKAYYGIQDYFNDVFHSDVN